MTKDEEAQVAELQALLGRIHAACGVAAERAYELADAGVIEATKVAAQAEAQKHQLSHARDNLDTQLRRARKKAERVADVLPDLSDE